MHRLLLIAMLVLSGCAGIQGYLFDLGLATEREHSGLEKRTIEIAGQHIHYLERRADHPAAKTIVLIHGFAANKDHWVRFVRFLPTYYRVLALDLPWHGDNEPDTTATYSISYLTTAVSSFVNEVAGRPVHVAGNSLGGRVAAELALAYPALTETISLFDPAGLTSPEPSELDLALARGDNLLIPTTRAEYDALTSIAFGDEPPHLPWPTAAVLSRRYAERAPLYRKMWNDLFSVPGTLETRLSDLTVPTLIVWGENDGVLDVSASEEWADRVPHARVTIMAGVGHAPMIERPAESAALLVGFVEQAHR